MKTTESPSWTALLTLVLWLLLAIVSVAGLALPYAHPQPPDAPPPARPATVLNVKFAHEDATFRAPPHAPPNAATVPTPPPLAPVTLPPSPALVAVAAANAPVAFALPVEGPVQVVAPREATYVRPDPEPSRVAIPSTAPTPGLPQRLIIGQGEGRQPVPEYPRRAMTAGQEGSVVVRFSVGEDGRVLAAEAATPCPWPLLNESAVRSIRERWRFATGAVRFFEVVIRFQLDK